MTYGRVHRHFLRTLMCKGVISDREAQRVLQTYSDTHQEVSEIISEINSKIRPFSQDIKRVRNERSGEFEVVIAWTGLGDSALCQGLYSQHEVLYWRKLLEEIAVAERKRIGAIEALNYCTGINITKTRAQDLMDEWTLCRYLEKLEGGSYTLGTRGIQEFEAYLRLNLPDTLDICMLCTKSVFQSKQCNNCGKYFHEFCLQTARGKMKTWPCCKKEYRDEQMEEETSQPTQSCSQQANVQVNMTASSEEDMNVSQEF